MDGKMRHVATLASTVTERCLFPLTHAMGLTTAHVRFVRGSLRPWPHVPSTPSSITRCICAGFDSMSIRHTIDSVRGPFESCAARKPASSRGPVIIVSFYYDVDTPFRFHRDCTDAGP